MTMDSLAEDKRNPNRLMHTMIFISLVIHLLLFMHISDRYRSESLSFIELTMQDISKPFSRSIPRPRMRQKPPEIRDLKKTDIQKTHMPKIKIDPIDNNFSENLMEGLSTPDIPDNSNLNISDWDYDGKNGFGTANDYFEMIRLKIESSKIYPETAKSRHIEGRVKIRFVVTGDGQVSSVKIVKKTGNISLNRAALNAVKNAAPFPRPPSEHFKGALHMEITIVFELT